jgi:transcriptional regulator with XRE-family HTH domain
VKNGREELKKVIGGRMKQAAKELDLDANDVADKLAEAGLDVRPQTVYNWWGGHRQPDLVDLQVYADAVGREVGWFFDPERQRVAAADDFAVRALWLLMEGEDFGEALTKVTNGKSTLSPRERRLVSAGTEGLRERISREVEWASLPAEDRLRLLRQIVAEVHRKGE